LIVSVVALEDSRKIDRVTHSQQIGSGSGCDDAGRRVQTTLANGATTTNSYDDGGKVIAIVYKESSGTLIGDLQYEYDAAGRRISMGGSLARLGLPSADVTDGTCDAADRLLTWAGQMYSYDNQGNLTSDGTNTYVWDSGTRLASIHNGDTTVASFQYDCLGRRIGKTINATTMGFVYDRDNVAQELIGVSPTAPIKTHLLTGGLDQVFLRLEGNTGTSQQSVLSDANNHTIGLLNASQSSSVNYTYEPYGATVSSAANENPQQYTGREKDNADSAGGLYYYRARYYMPGIARFISPDPLGWASGQTNRYAYAGGDPISLRDPSGLDGVMRPFGKRFGGGFGGGPRWFDRDDDSGIDALDRETKANKLGKDAKGPRATEAADLEERIARTESIGKAQREARRAGVGDAKIASIAKTEQNLATELRGIQTEADAMEDAESAAAEIIAAEKQVESVFEAAEEGAEVEEGLTWAIRLAMLIEALE
jgi:RHS repeat-associated protein